MDNSVAQFVSRQGPTNPHLGYASLGWRLLGFGLTPKKFADACVAIASEYIKEARQLPCRIVTSVFERVDDDHLRRMRLESLFRTASRSRYCARRPSQLPNE